MIAYVSEKEGSPSLEFTVECNGILQKSFILEKFPQCSGLQYRQNSQLRAVQLSNNQFKLPLNVNLSDIVFHCVHKLGLTDDVSDETSMSIWEYYELSTFDMRVVNLLNDTSNETFYNYFQKFGKLSLCELKTDPTTKKCKGFGFIRYENINDQADCVKSNHIINGKEVALRLSTNKIDAEKNKRMIFLSRITPSVTEEDILTHFSAFGKLTEFFMPLVKIRFGILTFESDKTVQCIFQHGHCHRVLGGFVYIDYINKSKNTGPSPSVNQSNSSISTYQPIIKQSAEPLDNYSLPSSSASCFSSSSSPSSDSLNYYNMHPYYYQQYMNADYSQYYAANPSNTSSAYPYYTNSQYYSNLYPYYNVNTSNSSTNPYYSSLSTQDSSCYMAYNEAMQLDQYPQVQAYQYDTASSFEYPILPHSPNKPNLKRSNSNVNNSSYYSTKTSKTTCTDIDLTPKTQKALNMLRNPEVLDTIINLSKILNGNDGE